MAEPCPECEKRRLYMRARAKAYYQRNRERIKAKNLAHYHAKQAASKAVV